MRLPTHDFIIAEAGLCNKLRSVLSYRHVALAHGRHLIVLWRRGAACDARFADCFEPLSGVTFLHDIAELSHPQRSALALAGGEAAASTYDSHPAVKYTDAESLMYSSLTPQSAIRDAVASAAAAFGGPFVAAHMRRTDHVAMFGDWTPDAAFCAFLDRHASLPIFLSTDNAATQDSMLRRYPTRLHGLAPVSSPPASGAGGGCCPSSERRHTSVERAVVDLFTCVEAERFMGTFMSSFSDAILLLRRANGRDVSGDEHVVRSLGGKHYDPEVHSVELPGL